MSGLTNKLQQIIELVYPDSKLVKSWQLTGGISALTITLEIRLSDKSMKKIVFRQHGELDRQFNPAIAQDEYRLLTILHSAGISVPYPIAVDSSNTIFDIPYLLIEFIDGETLFTASDLDSFLEKVVVELAKIHEVDLSRYRCNFLPQQRDILANRLQSAMNNHTEIYHKLRSTYPTLQQANPDCLLHGDYWLGNLLWREDQIVGVIDWEDAMVGDPLSDLGKSRLEILWAFGEPAMQTYTSLYTSLQPMIDLTNLPFWDLWGAIRLADFEAWTNDPSKLSVQRKQYEQFVSKASAQLNS